MGVGRGAKLPQASVGKPHNNETANNKRNGTDRLPLEKNPGKLFFELSASKESIEDSSRGCCPVSMLAMFEQAFCIF